MTLFHGSYVTVAHPDVKLGRARVDFGKGFYLTRLREQSVTWARSVARRYRGGVPILNSFDFNVGIAHTLAGDRYKVFESYDMEWLEYVVDCRKGGTLHEQYDVVEGGVANDNVIDTIELYENGDITAEQALGQLVYKKVNHQIAILNQRIVDACLRYIGSEEVDNAQ